MRALRRAESESRIRDDFRRASERGFGQCAPKPRAGAREFSRGDVDLPRESLLVDSVKLDEAQADEAERSKKGYPPAMTRRLGILTRWRAGSCDWRARSRQLSPVPES